MWIHVMHCIHIIHFHMRTGHAVWRCQVYVTYWHVLALDFHWHAQL